MSYKILPTKQFVKEFLKLDLVSQRRIKLKFMEVALDPARYKHLQYSLAASSRIRIGKLRVIFSYNVLLQELYLESIVINHKY